jgi:hypothetical protein
MINNVKNLFQSKIVVVLLSLNMVLLALYGVNYLVKKNALKNEIQSTRIDNSVSYEKAGVMSRYDYLKMDSIGDNLEKNGYCSDIELNWYLDKLKENFIGVSLKELSTKCIAKAMISTRIQMLTRSIPDSQKEIWLNALKEASLNPVEGRNASAYFITSASMVIRSKDKRGMDVLKPLKEHENANVRKQATKFAEILEKN